MAAKVLHSHLELLHAVLAQARTENYAVRQTLQLMLWLCYRLLDFDARCSEAYLTLAWLFCLYGEPQRACQLLLHADRQQPGQARIQAMLARLRSGPEADDGELPPPLPQLVPLDQLLSELQILQAGPQALSGPQLARRDAALKPVWQALDRRFKALG